MIRNYKALGLAFVAMLALSAFMAQTASAVPLTVEGKKVDLTGEQIEGKHKFTSSATVECTTATFSSVHSTETSGQINELTVTPTYTGCTAFGFATAHVKTNGCTYTFTTPTDIGVETVTWDASQVHILCPESKKIEITPTSFGVSVCTQSVAAQTPTDAANSHVVGTNVANSIPMDVALNVTLAGISYTGTGGACGTAGNNATYSGKATIRCYKAEPHTPENQIDCTFS